MDTEHKVLSFEQVSYNPVSDRSTTFVEGLDRLADSGWELVATYPSLGQVPASTTLFVFRRSPHDWFTLVRAAGVAQHLLEQAADTLHLDRGEETEGERKLRACAHRLQELLAR
jgi:hypothetical protein